MGAPTYDFANFCEKLHEIENILGRGGARAGGPPLNPPLPTEQRDLLIDIFNSQPTELLIYLSIFFRNHYNISALCIDPSSVNSSFDWQFQ